MASALALKLGGLLIKTLAKPVVRGDDSCQTRGDGREDDPVCVPQQASELCDGSGRLCCNRRSV